MMRVMEGTRVGVCHSCLISDLFVTKDTSRTDAEIWLCQLCEITPARRTLLYPSATSQHAEVLQTICAVGNLILKELRKKR